MLHPYEQRKLIHDLVICVRHFERLLQNYTLRPQLCDVCKTASARDPGQHIIILMSQTLR